MGATGPKCIFFFKFATRSIAEKKMKGGPVAPPTGDRWPPPTGATGGLSPPFLGRPGHAPLYKHPTPFPPHLSSKNPPKIQKKERGEEKGSGEALPDSALVICRLVHLVFVFFH